MRTKRFDRYTPLRVYWRDIISDPSWQNKAQAESREAVEVCTVGMFLTNRKRDLILASDVSVDGDTDSKVIPWGVIREVQILRPVEAMD